LAVTVIFPLPVTAQTAAQSQTEAEAGIGFDAGCKIDRSFAAIAVELGKLISIPRGGLSNSAVPV
jgi:hypothetical protein